MKKILCIDGGGIKGAFPASFLNTIEQTAKIRIVDYFDLIVGTSTGGIIALGLGLGMPTSEILEFYEKSGPQIFKRSNGFLKVIRRLFTSKYSNKTLRLALEAVFADRKLGESKCRLVVPSANLDTGEVYVYKTCHHERFQRDYRERVVDIALATAAAPTYFPEHIGVSGTPLVDGGVWANNPLTVAVVEAVGVLRWDPDDIRILSIGCTSAPFDSGRNRRRFPGMISWAAKLTDLFLTLQSSAAFGAAQLVVGNDNIVRVNPVVPLKRYSLDGTKGVMSLRGLGDSEARKNLPRLTTFFQNRSEPFIPFIRISEEEPSNETH